MREDPCNFELPSLAISSLSEQQNWPKNGNIGKQAAVCLLFIPPKNTSSNGKSSPRIVLTRRSGSVNTHKGQISLPGGRREPNDVDSVSTALRETREELGISTTQIINPIGLGPRFTSIDGSTVDLVIAVSHALEHEMTINNSEVEQLILPHWQQMQRSCSWTTPFNLYGKWRQSHIFKVDQHHIWGLTAAMIYALNLGGST